MEAVPVCLIQMHLSFSHAAACIQSQLSIHPSSASKMKWEAVDYVVGIFLAVQRQTYVCK